MTSRRRFIQTLAAIPPAFVFRHAKAAADPSRLALIIGNSAYHDAPLVNPANDAKAIGGLFTQAGFTVDSHLNAKRADMLAAIERFGLAAKRAETKLVVFYYAGHGAQLDWRNYLLPVDAVVQKQEDMKQRCVDLGLLLSQLSAAKDKTFIIILDACRNNPFGAAYRPEQKGLSQFDAPVGSLLAYATSPGNVASDGEGENGLYTENLVRELGKRGTRIEDALKRVRLNVRLASQGAQIPWETTSLEGDVFIFSEGQKKLSEAEMEQQLEADVTEWARIKSSKKIDDWVGYLRTFPNGRFAEIAQMRLTRLLADVEKQRIEKEQQEAARAEKLAAEKRREEEQKRQEQQQKRLEQERVERERARQAEEQRLAAERRQLEEQQRQEQRRREEEQKAAEAKRRQEQERLDKERERIAAAERLAEERRKQAEQSQLADQRRMEMERNRLAEAQRLAAERKRLEEQQLAETRRREEEQKRIELARRQEQERLERERQRIVEAERLAAERRQQEEQKRAEQEKLAAAKPAAPPAPAPAAPVPAASVPAAAAPAPRPTPPAAPAGLPLIEIRAGLPVPQLLPPSNNPYSAGRYPLGRIYTIGDSAEFSLSDVLTGVQERTYNTRVTAVDIDEDRVIYNNGFAITDLMGNTIKAGPVEYDTPVQFSPAEFQVGKKWTAAFRRTQKGNTTNAYYDLQIVKRETITVPAGTFDTFRIDGEGWNTTVGARLDLKLWLVPGLNFPVKSEFVSKNRFGRFGQTERRELIAVRQHATQSACLNPANALARNLEVRNICTA